MKFRIKSNRLHITFGVSVMALLVSVTYYSIYALNHENKYITLSKQRPQQTEQGNKDADNPSNDTLIQDPTNLEGFETGLLVGVDKSGLLTDVIMVFYVDMDAQKVKVISLPRDIKVDFRTEELNQIKRDNPKNHVLYCKLNEVYAYTGQGESGLADLKSVVSVITGMKIEYYATVDLEFLNNVVDYVGGVWFDVPQNMKYTDVSQDLKIDLKKGYQLLDGKKAEQLVRFRRYEWGDLQRIEVQRDFITALAQEILKSRTLREIVDIATLAYDGIQTNVPLSVVLNYSTYFYNNRTANLFASVNMMTIPSYPEEANSGPYFQVYDTKEVIDSINKLLEN